MMLCLNCERPILDQAETIGFEACEATQLLWDRRHRLRTLHCDVQTPHRMHAAIYENEIHGWFSPEPLEPEIVSEELTTAGKLHS